MLFCSLSHIFVHCILPDIHKWEDDLAQSVHKTNLDEEKSLKKVNMFYILTSVALPA